MPITKNHTARRYRRAAAGAVSALAIGGLIAGCGSSSATTASTTKTTPAASAAGTPSGARSAPAGFGKPATGAAAAKAKAAALAKYAGTVERVMQLGDGSYEVHVIRKTGSEVHVKVSASFVVTGTAQGPPNGGTPPSGGTPPGGGAAKPA